MRMPTAAGPGGTPDGGARWPKAYNSDGRGAGGPWDLKRPFIASVSCRVAVDPRVKGIRRIIQFEPDIEFCLRPDFVRGVQMLAEFDLTFDICISHIHMANTIKMVQQCPGVTFILDHIGKPDIAHGVTEPWKTQLKTLAGLPNVHCKMSGVVSEADHENWQPDDIRPYIDHVFDCFGLDRIMFGGDWPPVLQAAEYEKWVSTLLWAVEGLSDSQMKKLFRENARAFYRLEPGD